MEITYENICKKLGFDMETHKSPITCHEDDSIPNPFSALSDEESEFLAQYLIDRRKKNKSV